MSKITTILLILMAATITLSACSEPEPEKKTAKPADDEPFKVNIISRSIEASPSKESKPIFTYNENPLMAYDGGPKLRGIIKGDPVLAVIEIADHGFILKTGQKICDYKLISIGDTSATLIKNKKKFVLEMLL